MAWELSLIFWIAVLCVELVWTTTQEGRQFISAKQKMPMSALYVIVFVMFIHTFGRNCGVMSKNQGNKPGPDKATRQEKKFNVISTSGPEGRRTVVHGKVIRNDPPRGKNGK